MHVHRKGMDTLHEKIDKKILPEEYGGQAGSINDLWSKSRPVLQNIQAAYNRTRYVFLNPPWKTLAQ
jgi:hypothetical protein